MYNYKKVYAAFTYGQLYAFLLYLHVKKKKKKRLIDLLKLNFTKKVNEMSI